MEMNEFKIKTKVYEIILEENGNFKSLVEITKRIQTKYMKIGSEESGENFVITLYYIEESEDKWRMVYKDQLLFSTIVN
jgi:lipopolysaccharide biosynthesis regulator YciM